jgi:integrase
MRARRGQRQQVGPYYLWQRSGAETWQICWVDRGADGRARTRRKSTGIVGGEASEPPQQAIDALYLHYQENTRKPRQTKEDALVDDLLADWLKYHVRATLQAPDRYAVSAQHWLSFFEIEQKAGRLGPCVTVADVTPELRDRFYSWRAAAGVGGHTIGRDIAALRGALNWAWKAHRLEAAPYIADVPAHRKAPPRERILSFQEIGRMLDKCADRPDRKHLIRYIVLQLGTAGRPQAILELTEKDLDLERNRIDLSGGKVHPRKRRPVVPIAKHVRPWVEDVEGKLIRYRVPIAEKNREPGGPEFYERDTSSIKTAWNAVCAEAGVNGATPKTLRHTMLTWLAERGVPLEQLQLLAGHSAKSTTARNYIHLSPDYLQAAVDQIDAIFEELAKHTKVPLICTEPEEEVRDAA